MTIKFNDYINKKDLFRWLYTHKEEPILKKGRTQIMITQCDPVARYLKSKGYKYPRTWCGGFAILPGNNEWTKPSSKVCRVTPKWYNKLIMVIDGLHHGATIKEVIKQAKADGVRM